MTTPATPPPSARASLAVTQARIWTGTPEQPWAEALAVRDGVVIDIGTNAAITALGAERTVDARGRVIVPGFIDAHVHFIEGGFRLASVQLRDARTTRESSSTRIKAFAATVPAGTWITGGDWDHERLGRRAARRATGSMPVTPRASGLGQPARRPHGAGERRGPARGRRDARDARTSPAARSCATPRGEPTGVLKDNAMALVDRVVPAADRGADAIARSTPR